MKLGRVSDFEMSPARPLVREVENAFSWAGERSISGFTYGTN
jgi:hypothetical protein